VHFHSPLAVVLVTLVAWTENRKLLMGIFQLMQHTGGSEGKQNTVDGYILIDAAHWWIGRKTEYC